MNTDHLTRQQTFDQSVALVRRALPHFSSFMMPMYKEWHSYKKYIAHVMRLEEVFGGWDKSSSSLINRFAFAELLTKAGYYLREISLADSGLAILGTAESIISALSTSCSKEPNAGTNISLEAHDSINTGSVAELQATILQISWGIIATTQGLAGRQKSMENITKVLRLRRESYAKMPLGCDKTFWSRVLLANAHNDMACQFLDSEQYSEAEAHLQTSLEMKDGLASERPIPPFLYAESKKNLAIVRLGQGKGKEVMSLSQEAVNLLQKEDSHYSLVRFIHGTCLMNMGTTAEALMIFEEVYTLCLATFGKAGMHTRNSLYAIALAQYRLERFEEARYGRFDRPCTQFLTQGVADKACFTDPQ
jgi:tetratricopeptide (TPR) repeat protein